MLTPPGETKWKMLLVAATARAGARGVLPDVGALQLHLNTPPTITARVICPSQPELAQKRDFVFKACILHESCYIRTCASVALVSKPPLPIKTLRSIACGHTRCLHGRALQITQAGLAGP